MVLVCWLRVRNALEFLASLFSRQSVSLPIPKWPTKKNVAAIHYCISPATFTHVASWNIRVGMFDVHVC